VKRSTWVTVLVAAAVLVAAGNLPRVRWDAAGGAGTSALARVAGVRLPLSRYAHALPAANAGPAVPVATRPVLTAPIRYTPPRLLVTPMRPWRRPALDIPPFALFGGLVVAGVLALASAIAWRVRTDRRGRVFHMARRGLHISRIARRAHVPQDAVRTLLTPGMGARR
jgi:hypothetical protein